MYHEGLGSQFMREDVAIVGAGPAGAWAAYQLARVGARVALFDPSHPREKACGGGVTGRALAIVEPALAAGAFTRTVIRRARFVDSAAHRSAIVTLRVPAVDSLPDLV